MGRGQGLWLWLANRLDKIWLHQAVKFGFTADLTGTGNRSFLIVLKIFITPERISGSEKKTSGK